VMTREVESASGLPGQGCGAVSAAAGWAANKTSSKANLGTDICSHIAAQLWPLETSHAPRDSVGAKPARTGPSRAGRKRATLLLKMLQAAKSAGELIGADLCNRRLSYRRAPSLKTLDFDAITAQLECFSRQRL